MAVDQRLLDGLDVVVAVDVAQVGQVHGVLGRLLWVAREAEGADLEAAPALRIQRSDGQAPLGLPSVDAPPGEDEAEYLLGLEDAQLRGPGRLGEGRGDALAGGVEFVAVEGAEEPAVADAPPGGGAQVGPKVRADGLGDADTPVVVAPDYDVLAHPGLLDELVLQDGLARCYEVPAFGKGG